MIMYYSVKSNAVTEGGDVLLNYSTVIYLELIRSWRY